MERARILGDLVREVLGPREGIAEQFPDRTDPRDEYIIGVLAPMDTIAERDPDAEAELLPGDYDEDGDGGETGAAGIASEICSSPSLDPKSLAKSMGLSFVIQATGENPIEICSTWARYVRPGGWQRQPFYNYRRVDVLQDDEWRSEADPGVAFSLRVTPVADTIFRISVYLVNRTEVVSGQRPDTTKHIFQPEIRIVCSEGTQVIPLRGISDRLNAGNDNTEDLSLELMYRNRPALARGHLTGVTWSAIDIQRPCSGCSSPSFPPFIWTDGGIVPDDLRVKFTTPTLRTDYVPSYPVGAPGMTWRIRYGPEPEFNPRQLAEFWVPEDIRTALQPLAEGYRNWLEEQRICAREIETEYETVIQTNLAEIEASISRIEQGISLLCADEETRLAFCFANRVMALQAEWSYGRINNWRPFQLAFILQNLCAIHNPEDPGRDMVDLLWFPTGGGKTESYLGLAVFAIALQRRRANTDRAGHKHGAGVNVISRYTLRLLTIQQYRRALKAITAAEFLRVWGLNTPAGSIGWRPTACELTDDYIWGGERISIGLWVGKNVTPNSIQSITFRDENNRIQMIPGALAILKNPSEENYGEPAQVLTCPCCNTILAVPRDGLGQGRHRLYLLVRGREITTPDLSDLVLEGATVQRASVIRHSVMYHTVLVEIEVPADQKISPAGIEAFWRHRLLPVLGTDVRLYSAHSTRPGYFIRHFINQQTNPKGYCFDVICPNPECGLNSHAWSERVPVSVAAQTVSGQAETEYQDIPEPFKIPGHPNYSSRVVIPAYTVDDQIYHRCPSMVIATADKLAQMPFEPLAAGVFGNVEFYHARWGYYRETCPPSTDRGLCDSLQFHPGGYNTRSVLHKAVPPFAPPVMIIQDELHLIEGPLGSLFGLYETVVDELCSVYVNNRKFGPKYVTSTATVRCAGPQVQSLFTRRLAQFPASGINVEDNFFSVSPETHPLEAAGAGRLYVGICAPGKGAQTPLIRIFSSLFQSTEEMVRSGAELPDVDGFHTVVGYFNAVRELAGAVALYRQDIRERMRGRFGTAARLLRESPLELSGRSDSMELPGLLERLSSPVMAGTAEDFAVATSMFGTGVDIDRLRLMVVAGQPKSTSSYIQATGRVGRSRGGLSIAFFRASRPRDLDHYEFFTGYHRALYKFVEPVSVAPFSPRAREKTFGPLAVALLRLARTISGVRVSRDWRHEQRLNNRQYDSGAASMRNARLGNDVRALISLIEQRAQNQPPGRQADIDSVRREIRALLDEWENIARRYPDQLLYSESSMTRTPIYPVVLGDLQHFFQNLDMAFENVPQSMRSVEGTTTFKT
ncbi:helicase|uniref:Helicase conserved C-terminal domain-containing protein n=1 Tax=Dendrosporobacter quercicolus TaxID=146817 RepID=A0A1H0AJN3_9FIRM|nr:DISARM system helicase DrmA [Dendrosporobacter quercicolus]NSL49636.1 helicase [Dendrosporobacter quercicolus DSM 1736]SDN33778.1 Helicase conserved C-terminal domain-containing protein [Dendrosporobacter quercicolus]